jgi:hypothetical protein
MKFYQQYASHHCAVTEELIHLQLKDIYQLLLLDTYGTK